MSSKYYDTLWRDSIQHLKTQVKSENDHTSFNDDLSNKSKAKAKSKFTRQSTEDFFQYLARLYVNYIHIFHRLEICYDAIIQPQKRLDVKATLEVVISRIIEIKYHLNSFCNLPSESSSEPVVKQPSSEIDNLNLEPILRSLNMSPNHLEIPIPRFFKEDEKLSYAQRDALIAGYMKLRLGIDKVELKRATALYHENKIDMAVKKSIACSEKNENLSNYKWIDDPIEEIDFETDDSAATAIQKIARGLLSRKKTSLCEKREKTLIGMRNHDRREMQEVENSLRNSYSLRKQEQSENHSLYEEALVQLKNIVLEEEGYEIREKLREERTNWITEQIANTNTIPDSLDSFYQKDLQQNELNDESIDAEKKTNKKEQNEKLKKEDCLLEETDKNIWKSESLDLIHEDIKLFEENWLFLDEPEYNREKCNISMAKDRIIRPQIESELANSLDHMLLMHLKHIKGLHEDKKKKGKKDRKKQKKGKKGKKGKNVGKSSREKPLPGSKIPEMKNMDTEEMLSILIENKVIINDFRKDLKISDFIGEDFSCPSDKSSNNSQTSKMIGSRLSSLARLRGLVTENCILPLGSRTIRSKMNEESNIRSIMFNGPEGSGKKFMAEIVAAELGAMLIDISPFRLRGIFDDKGGPTKLIHLIFSLVKEKLYAPVVIFMDDCEQFFLPLGKKKKRPPVDKNGPVRFQKDLLIYKNQSLNKDDRVIIIGNSKRPEVADLKSIKWKGPAGKPEKQGFFEMILSFPFPSYPDRYLLWRTFIQERIINCDKTHDINHSSFNLNALALLSEGQTAGSIKKIVENVLSFQRVRRLKEFPLKEEEFIIMIEKTKLSSLNI